MCSAELSMEKVLWVDFPWISIPPCTSILNLGIKILEFFTDETARPRSYKTFFILNSTEHEISTAHKTKIPTFKEVSCFQFLRCIYLANKCKNANNCWNFNIIEQFEFHAQLS